MNSPEWRCTPALLLGMKLCGGQPPGGRHPHAHTGKGSFRNGAKKPKVSIREFKSILKALVSIQKKKTEEKKEK